MNIDPDRILHAIRDAVELIPFHPGPVGDARCHIGVEALDVPGMTGIITTSIATGDGNYNWTSRHMALRDEATRLLLSLDDSAPAEASKMLLRWTLCLSQEDKVRDVVNRGHLSVRLPLFIEVVAMDLAKNTSDLSAYSKGRYR